MQVMHMLAQILPHKEIRKKQKAKFNQNSFVLKHQNSHCTSRDSVYSSHLYLQE